MRQDGGVMFRQGELTIEVCEELAPRIREHDKLDCIAHDYDPLGALISSMEAGPSTAVYDGDICIGALGWTFAGMIWSLWTDLTDQQKREIMKLTPEVIRQIAAQAGRPLQNVVWEGNRLTLAWLKASKCFLFLEQRLDFNGRQYIPFFVKPLGDLANV